MISAEAEFGICLQFLYNVVTAHGDNVIESLCPYMMTTILF